MQTRKPGNAVGVDVSHYQGKIDWNKVKASGVSFAIMKATEGRTFIDDRFTFNVQGASAAGIVTGAYHFCRAGSTKQAVLEAKHFVDAVESAGGVDLPLALDLESKEAGTRANAVAVAKAFVAYVQSRGHEVMLYTFPSFVDEMLDASLADLPLWYANYDVKQPKDRGGWKRWFILQHTDKGNVAGINVKDNLDMNEFDGSVEELMAAVTKGPALDRAIAVNILKSYLQPAWKAHNEDMEKALAEGRTEDAKLSKQARDWQGLLGQGIRKASGIGLDEDIDNE